MKKNALISIILCISIMFYGLFYVDVQQAKAVPVNPITVLMANIVSMIENIGDELANTDNLAETIETLVWNMAQAALKIIADNAIVIAKYLALLAVQKATTALIGGGNGLLIRDWNNYLYTSPQQTALKQMDAFFTTTSKGRLSSLNYEGVGPNYDAYLVTQAKQAISSPTPVTNIQEQVTNPKADLFSGGNMKGIMSYMQCANNVACYTLMATDKYTTEVSKAQTIAKNEQQNGVLPTKSADGRIIKPAALVSNALMEVDKQGQDLIMSADPDNTTDPTPALTQIAEGTALSITARAINYGISDNNGKAATVAQNAKFPFSLSYNSLITAK
jgi:hypothetical protein